jgi:hypothetical protein
MTFPNLTARSLKATLVLEAAEILAATQQIQRIAGRVALRINVAGRSITAGVNSKSLRKCLATIAEAGHAGAVVVIQGKLVGENLTEAGIAATVQNA